MKYSEIKNLVKYSAAFKLFKKEYAGFIIFFLNSIFKEEDRLTISAEDMELRLADMVEEYREKKLLVDEMLQSPDYYINEWSNDGLIRKYYDETSGEFQVELTPETESVIQWIFDIRKIEKKEVVGTKSRFLNIFHLLSELVEETVSEPEEKVKRLEQEKLRIEKEIERIKSGGNVKTFEKAEFVEQYKFALKEAYELVADFRQIERNFSDITKQAQNNYLNQIATRGDVLSYVLDADKELMQSDQGKSFKAFWQFLQSPSQQEELERIISILYRKPEIREVDEEEFFRKFKKLLLDSGKKVNRATEKMADQIRKALSDRSLQENRRIKDIIAEIKSLALQQNKLLQSRADFFILEALPEAYLPLERPLWEKKDKTLRTEEPEAADQDEMTEEMLATLMNQNAINLDELLENIDSFLKYKPETSLKEILEKYPLKKGLEELVTYIWLATQKGKHSIIPETEETFEIITKDGEKAEVKFPLTVFNV